MSFSILHYRTRVIFDQLVVVLKYLLQFSPRTITSSSLSKRSSGQKNKAKAVLLASDI